MTQISTLADVKDNLFSSNFQIQHNHIRCDNEYYVSEDDLNNMDNDHDNEDDLADVKLINIEQPRVILLAVIQW